MSQAESLIILLLAAIAYFLYHIAKQLSYLTGKKLKIGFPKWQTHNPLPKKDNEKEKFSN